MALSVGEAQEPNPDEGKDPIAVELGRRGGLIGGKARASKMTPEQRAQLGQTLLYARRKKKLNNT